jgi:glycosyltransferase involved in cell wall biosynthesis
MKEGYIQKEKRKKVLGLFDDLRFASGISTMAREFVIGTSHQLNWTTIGGAINHPEKGKRLDLSDDTNKVAGITDSYVILYPTDGYGSQDLVRQVIEIEKPDILLCFTDPRYWVWLWQMENEIRRKIPIAYLSLWDCPPAPLYNAPYYESCDLIMSISKQSKNLTNLVLGSTNNTEIIDLDAVKQTSTTSKPKVRVKYVPHGINDQVFHPITEYMGQKYTRMQELRKGIFGKDNPEFVCFYNARNIRRKSTSDLIAAWSAFTDSIGKERASKCALLLHTNAIDENGTDLPAVIELLCDPSYQKVYINEDRLTPEDMNCLYNIGDVTALISSNEGWGLSLTESMMAGKMIIGNVTGGMQDQMRFTDEDGKWIDFNENFCSNHFGTHKDCGEWARPVFPSNSSIVGSIPTPYIFDDRCDIRDVAKAIEDVYNLSPEERSRKGMAGRTWAMSGESNMSAKNMCQGIYEGITETIEKFEPRAEFELIKTGVLPRKKMPHPMFY